ncbi:MAG TPA: DUF1684 domain-containing protein [Rhodanobacteraceae bacterium]|nr:DUF1684 domain-containing protein [Rhodanobacteraceae bacterium]
MLKITLLFAAAVAGVQLMSAGVDADYSKQIETARAQRVERLKAPDGWLSLIGLHWLKDGSNRVGSADDNDVVLARGPAHLGTVTLHDGKAKIDLAPGSGATIDGKRQKSAELLDDSHAKPTRVAFGTVSFYLIDRSGKKGLRVKDTKAASRTHFLGIDYFPIDPSWRVEATWVPFKPAHHLEIPTVIGTVDRMPVPGKAVFRHGAKTYTLLPVLEEPDARELFFIIADRTSGKQTYGAARFLYTALPKNGKLVIDFNLAYNPPCAFTPYATCPLAPPENRLDVAVTAGEKKYRGSHD